MSNKNPYSKSEVNLKLRSDHVIKSVLETLATCKQCWLEERVSKLLQLPQVFLSLTLSFAPLLLNVHTDAAKDKPKKYKKALNPAGKPSLQRHLKQMHAPKLRDFENQQNKTKGKKYACNT